MTRIGRSKITCTKKLPNGITERFEVVVKTEDVDKAIKKYKEQGYTVFN